MQGTEAVAKQTPRNSQTERPAQEHEKEIHTMRDAWNRDWRQRY
jgi:hypothetical protein